ncbi:MAG: hypothetical protein P0Y59_22755 [Candidatus Sphingomonas phytovorans]|nr:hypothetical protein [Sphingomonas sp.]WEJ99692.1 MAG: hypothetical protein P0Y59_22755 [Sphingomonas sp.]
MEHAPFELVADLLADPDYGWSIGSFGAIGEFVRDADEEARMLREPGRVEIVTARGAIRVVAIPDLTGLAWDSLSADGESWGHSLAFCLPRPGTPGTVVVELGPDDSAIRVEDRASILFDLGVGAGCVHMCARTADPALVQALRAAAGQPLLSVPGIMPAVLKAQPHRVLLSPAGRIEVFQPIPPADGKSPAGPHTHLLPKLIAKDRTHSANVPIPDGWQSVLSAHPRSPWRTMMGERHPFDPAVDRAFAPLLDRFALAEDVLVATELTVAIDRGLPEAAAWPDSRRGRTKARIVLRRLAAAGDARVKPWRAMHDRAPVEIEEGEEV